MIDDTMLRLYLSGNLDQETAAQIEEQLRRDPDLRQRMEEMRAGEPSFSNQEVEAGKGGEQPRESADGHLGATEDQIQPNVEPIARNPILDHNAAGEAGIDPHTEITPG